MAVDKRVTAPAPDWTNIGRTTSAPAPGWTSGNLREAGWTILPGGGTYGPGTYVATDPKTGNSMFVDANGNITPGQTSQKSTGSITGDVIRSVGQDIRGDIVDPALEGVGLKGPGGAGGGALNSAPASVTDPIQAAIARSAAISDQQGQAAANYQPVAAPTVAGPGQIYAEFAQKGDPIQAAIAQAQAAEAAQVGQTVLTPQQQAIQAQQIEAARIAQTQVGPTSLANAAQINTDPQAEMRAAQTGLVSGLQGAISGKEPSVAAIMLRNATDRNVANQYAMAQAANGMNTGFAQRTAMNNAAEMNQNAVMQQALLRAQEITAARGQLGSVLDSTRGADIGLATNQAGMQQQTNLANTGAQNTSTLTQAQIAAATATNQAQLQQGAATANQGANLQAGTTNATLGQQVALANAGAQNTTNQTNAQLTQGANLQNAQLGTQTAIANAGNQTQAATSSAQLANAVSLANANNQTQANVTGAQLGTQAAIATGNNQVSTNALNQKAVQDLTSNQLTGAGQAGQTAIGQGDVYAKLADAEAKRQAALLQGLGSGAAALLSDRREKTDLHKAEAEIAEFTSKLEPYAFRYKAPTKPGAAPGKRYGIMAQDLEKSAVGRSLLLEDEDGTKAVDVPQSIGAILATLSAMNRRIDRAEARV